MPFVRLATSLGDIVVKIDDQKAPVSAKNFLDYVDAGHYDGTVFHRVISTFMIQGGGFTVDLKQKATKPGIKNEWQNGLKNRRGTLAMARLGGKPDSATCQFFINVVDNAFLDQPQSDGAAYAVFGNVVSGIEVVDKIKGVKTGKKAFMDDVPVQPVTINSAKRLSDAEAAAL